MGRQVTPAGALLKQGSQGVCKEGANCIKFDNLYSSVYRSKASSVLGELRVRSAPIDAPANPCWSVC
eukprot:6173881-Pleurochrysis_carterae.AAC.1